jgi:hypothetical protein
MGDLGHLPQDIFGFHVPQWALHLWAWLPWIVAGVAGVATFLKNMISILESHTYQRLFGMRFSRWRVGRLRRKLAEAEAESDYRESQHG